MRKFFLCLLSMFTIFGASMAQTLTVEDVEVLPGTTGKLTLKINVGDGEYTGFQYGIQFPSTGFSTPTTGKSTVNASWTYGSIIPGNLAEGKGRVSAISMSNDLIPTGDIEIGTVSFDVANDVPIGEYDVTISNFEFLSGTTRTPVSDVTFKVKVVNALSVILDETSTTPPVNAIDVNVIVKLTINANEWSTICLPFAMSEAQVKAAFGYNVELADFLDYDYDGETITVNFEEVTKMKANHPYIIMVPSKVEKFTVDGVDIFPKDNPRVEYDNGLTGRHRVVYGGFYGTYQAQTELEEFALFLSENNFWYSTGLTKMKAFRAYFYFNDILPELESAESRIIMSVENKTTPIKENLNLKSQSPNIYDLQGRKVIKPTKGLYIKSGKKIIK